MPTHPECLYYLYKGYTHARHIYFYCDMRERNQNPLHTHTFVYIYL